MSRGKQLGPNGGKLEKMSREDINLQEVAIRMGWVQQQVEGLKSVNGSVSEWVGK
jgi:hypothetical protein